MSSCADQHRCDFGNYAAPAEPVITVAGFQAFQGLQQHPGEDMLLTGPLEPTNKWYALTKIAGIKLVEAYR